MNKQTIIFLICLLAPLAFAQNDVLSMLDKTVEGKKVLDSLFVQTKLLGDNPEAEHLRDFFRVNRENLEKEREDYDAWIATRNQECDEDRVHLEGLVHGHVDRHLAVKRQLEVATGAKDRVNVFATRSNAELANYKTFEGYIRENRSAWREYFSTVSSNYRAVGEVLRQIVEAGAAQTQTASFAQISQSYRTSLASIKVKIQSTNVEFTGMGPIIDNLVQIMSEPQALAKPEVRAAIKRVANTLLESVRDRLEIIEEDNEHQNALFEHLEKAFQENGSRAEKEVTGFAEAVAALNKRVEALTSAVTHAANLSARAETLAADRENECQHYNFGVAGTHIRFEKMISIMREVNDVLLTHTGSLPAFFIQRELKRN